MMLDLGGRLERGRAGAERRHAGRPARRRCACVQAYASMLARQGRQRARRSTPSASRCADGRDLPVLADLLATLEAGGTPQPPFDDATGGMADALLGIAEALHQERGNRARGRLRPPRAVRCGPISPRPRC